MAILSRIGRRSPGVVLLVAAIYVVLAAGAVTMVYPFLVLVSGSTKSAVDLSEYDVFPRFLHDDLTLYRKHVEGLFNESLAAMNIAYGTEFRTFGAVEPPTDSNPKLAQAWDEFLRESPPPPSSRACGYIEARVSRTVPSGLRGFRQFVAARHGGDLAAANRALGTEAPNWNAFAVVREDRLGRVRTGGPAGLTQALDEFKATVPLELQYWFAPESYYRHAFLPALYGGDLQALNRAHGTDYAAFDAVPCLDRCLAEAGAARDDWLMFMREAVGLLWIRADDAAAPVYRAYLAAKYGAIDTLNHVYGTAYDAWESVPLSRGEEEDGAAWSDWALFLAGWLSPEGELFALPEESFRLVGIERLFRDWLAQRYGDPAAINRALGTDFQTSLKARRSRTLSGFLHQHTSCVRPG